MLTIIDANIKGYIVLFKSLVPLLIYAYFAPRGQIFCNTSTPFLLVPTQVDSEQLDSVFIVFH